MWFTWWLERAYLGILVEDNKEKSRAWQVSGIPHTWGPASVRAWLQDNYWHIEAAPKPPNSKFRTTKSFAYQLVCGNRECNVTIQRWQKQRKPTAEEQESYKKIKGARWWSCDQSDPIEDIEVTPTLRYTEHVFGS